MIGNQFKAGEFWYEDEPYKSEYLTHANVKACAKPVAESKSLELQGRLHLDLVLQEKYLPNGLEFRLKLNHASPQFSIMSDTPVVLKIDSTIISVRYVQLLPATANDINQSIARSPAKFSHKTCRSENIHDRYGFTFENRRSSLPRSTYKTCIHRYDQQRSFQRFF